MRGTETQICFTEPIKRITPACAGNRRKVGLDEDFAEDHPRVCGEQDHHHGIFRHDKDHPRVCGEQPAQMNYSVISAGSPPRVRGTD